MAEGDRQQLVEFAENVQTVVAGGLERHKRELSEDLLSDLQTVWAGQAERFDRLVEVLRVSGPPAPQSDFDGALQDMGLEGLELKIKLQLYGDAVAFYEQHPTPTSFGDVLAAAGLILAGIGRVFPWIGPVAEVEELIQFPFVWSRGRIRRFLIQRGAR